MSELPDIMSLTIVYRSKKVRFAYNFSKRQLVAGTVLLFGLMMISSRSTHQIEESHARINYTQTGLELQRKEVEQLKSDTSHQISGMMLKLGEIQGELHRINALGAKLVKQAELNPEEFSFDQLPPVGGPQSTETVEYPTDNSLLTQIDDMLVTLENKSQQLLICQ